MANSLHDTIKFTSETSLETGQLNFLNITFTLEDNQLESELFIKPSNSGISLHFSSCHPMVVKLNTARNHFKTAIQLSSGEAQRDRSVSKVVTLLMNNGYPTKVVDSLKHESLKLWVDVTPVDHPVSMMCPHSTLNCDCVNAESPDGQLKSIDQPQESDSQPQKSDKLCLSLPYHSEKLLKRCKSIIREADLGIPVVVTSKPAPSLKQRLVKSQFKPPPCPRNCVSCATSTDKNPQCNSKLVIYRVKCESGESDSSCDGSYIGQSKRYPHDRLSEHCSNIKHVRDDKSVSTHFIENHNDFPNVDRKISSSILGKGKDYVDMMILEAQFIQEEQPSMNNYAGKWKLLGT